MPKPNSVNRRLIDDFRIAHPEYKESFGGIVARLYRPDKSGGFGTVFDDAKGGYTK